MPLIIPAIPLALNVLEMVIQPKSLQIYPNYSRKNKMPYSAKQNKLFRAAEHNPAIAKKVGIPQATAAKMASEGVKKDPHKLAQALMSK
jgi:hypothetical protein